MEKGWLSGISIPLYLLVIVFNLASWIDLNAVWTEMPLLVNRLPEGWELPAYFSLIINGGKIPLIAYVILKKIMKDNLQEYPFVYAIIVIGVICLFVTAFVWDRTSIIAGKEVSLAVMIPTFILASVDTLSSVVFLPYLSRFGARYITASFVGEGINQLLPAVIGIIQGVGEIPDCRNHTIVTYNETAMLNSTSYQIVPIYPDPTFSVQTFFVVISGIMVLSGIAFALIHHLPHFKKKRLTSQNQSAITGEDVKKTNKLDPGESNGIPDVEDSAASPAHLHTGPNEPMDVTLQRISRGDFLFCLVLITWGYCVMLGLMPGVQSYSALPYGNRAYNLSLRLGLAVNPITSFLALFVYTRSKVRISVLSTCGTAATIYQVILACYSPHPPLKGTAEGEALVVSMLCK